VSQNRSVAPTEGQAASVANTLASRLGEPEVDHPAEDSGMEAHFQPTGDEPTLYYLVEVDSDDEDQLILHPSQVLGSFS
jgi:hypothetical protein